jgi:hypothetical protein
MILIRETPLQGSLEGGGGPENRDFLGPEMTMSEANAIWPCKSLQYSTLPSDKHAFTSREVPKPPV